MEKKHKRQVVHSRFRKGLSDYHDEANLHHYGGNDDYANGANLPDEDIFENPYLDGKTAEGNEGMDESEFLSAEEKFEAIDRP